MKTTDKSLKDKAVKIKWKDYVQVKDRIQYLSDNYEWRYELDSYYDYFPERKMRVVRATLTIWDEDHTHCCTYWGLAQEVESENYKEVNFSSCLENCQTSARGRAAAAAGIWIQCDWWIASANEMQKAINRQKTYPPKKDEKWNPNGWFQKAINATDYMKQCLDENDYINKIKDKYEVDEIAEHQLRTAYKNALWIDDATIDLPFQD